MMVLLRVVYDELSNFNTILNTMFRSTLCE